MLVGIEEVSMVECNNRLPQKALDLRLIFERKVFRVRGGLDQPPFWYLSDEPGPFYLSAERIIGSNQVPALLKAIDAALTGTHAEAVPQIETLILSLYRQTETYRTLVRSLIGLMAALPFQPAEVSGGERRDWLFSVPVAAELGLPHVWLFKNRDALVKGHAELMPPSGGRVHVADLLNRGLSFADYWIPALSRVNRCADHAIFVVDRSVVERNQMPVFGIPYSALLRVDPDFVDIAHRQGFITEEDAMECKIYMRSSEDWLRDIFMPKVSGTGKFCARSPKDVSRIQTFCDRRNIYVSHILEFGEAWCD